MISPIFFFCQFMRICEIKYLGNLQFYIDSNSTTTGFAKLNACKCCSKFSVCKINIPQNLRFFKKYIHYTRYYILCNLGMLFCSTVKSVRNVNKWVELVINGFIRPRVHHRDIPRGGGLGHSSFLFGGCGSHRFPKMGLESEFSWKNEGSWEQQFGKFAYWELKFLPKQGWKCKICLTYGGTWATHWW